MVDVEVGDGSGRLQVVFFNQPWREKQLREGLQVALFGKAEVYRGGLQMTNPIVDLIGDRTGRIVPIYPQSEKAALSTWEIAGWVEDALRKCCGRAASPTRCPDAVRRALGLIDRGDALRSIHLPETMRREGAGPPPAGLRRAAAGADRAGDAQAGARARVARHPPHGRRRAGRRVSTRRCRTSSPAPSGG